MTSYPLGFFSTLNNIMSIVPIVSEQSTRGERQFDIFSRLLRDRIIFMGYPLDDAYANLVIAQLLFLDAEDPEKDIYLYINSPGGYITSGLAVYDTMQYVRSDIRTICIGQASSIASLLLASGTPGKRSALPNSRVMLHQPVGGVQGQSRDIEIQAKEILEMKAKLNVLYSKHAKKSLTQVEKDIDRIFYMSAIEAKQYGLIDNLIEVSKNKVI